MTNALFADFLLRFLKMASAVGQSAEFRILFNIHERRLF